VIGDAVEDFVPYFREQFDHVGERGKGEARSKTEEALSGKWALSQNVTIADQSINLQIWVTLLLMPHITQL
jgi:hypothetical protein